MLLVTMSNFLCENFPLNSIVAFLSGEFCLSLQKKSLEIRHGWCGILTIATTCQMHGCIVYSYSTTRCIFKYCVSVVTFLAEDVQGKRFFPILCWKTTDSYLNVFVIFGEQFWPNGSWLWHLHNDAIWWFNFTFTIFFGLMFDVQCTYNDDKFWIDEDTNLCMKPCICELLVHNLWN